VTHYRGLCSLRSLGLSEQARRFNSASSVGVARQIGRCGQWCRPPGGWLEDWCRAKGAVSSSGASGEEEAIDTEDNAHVGYQGEASLDQDNSDIR